MRSHIVVLRLHRGELGDDSVPIVSGTDDAVSYTHLDVYKRQVLNPVPKLIVRAILDYSTVKTN